VSAAVFGVLLWRLGTGPFVDGVRTVDGRALVAATAIGLVTTVCCAWRWKTVAAGLGFDLPLPAAVAAYYRSLLRNVTLPGGVVGDVHRGISHGSLRAVVWERFAGQVVQAVVTVAVLLAMPSPVQSLVPPAAVGVLVVVACVVLIARRRLALRAWPGIAVASALVVAGHAITFLIAARTAGVSAPPSRMLPLALLVMLVMALPSVAGWGPREGAAAWAFGAAGLGADRGVATGVVYGVMVLVACLPGAAVLAVSWARRSRPPVRTEPSLEEGVAHA
jgi:hypothetical protein